ncbi:hypothetical protein VNO77_25406 [Canavalia gladiata]|uniref:Secreted protein n=1 Tax=Canavalia gladiata TaxID=3824 RepID=A0AAN9QH26_CANGL
MGSGVVLILRSEIDFGASSSFFQCYLVLCSLFFLVPAGVHCCSEISVDDGLQIYGSNIEMVLSQVPCLCRLIIHCLCHEVRCTKLRWLCLKALHQS